MLNGKLAKHDEEEKKGEPGSPTNFQDALRLPNISLKQSATFGQNLESDGYASPTNLLNSQAQVYDNLKLTNDESQFIQYEGELLRKAAEGKLKRYWYCLLGKEFYCKFIQNLSQGQYFNE